MKLTAGEFKNGYNSMVVQETNRDMNMDFGVQRMSEGDAVSYNEPKESIYVLIFGKVTFEWDGKRETVERTSCFKEDPILLHVPQNTAVSITCVSDKAEVAIQRTTNPKSFVPRLMKSQDLLCASEQRGAGLMNEASTRIVRTFFDRSNCPETNFFIGEVVSYPGKWSSFPPHFHVEPEIYFYKFLPENGYGFAEIGDDVYKVRHNDLTGMPSGLTHSQATAPGYAEYYIWVIRLQDNVAMKTILAPEHAWVADKEAKYFPEI
ncbi:5-deoxy-glucuronate isomerase [Brenneria izadpanahii]|uniref:5-deoxy-glucuronate isomerase n=1 Tax=Brenneria izadpanahii TaxID=2722756 RepID=A0ABX7UUM1_9GAMM|nr:5-deoxy-glucuronate isomerase [Brenneria izadpanahii]QTF08995.1 5-deoxy-glucuronate isomerase [Brenneria izadpanahii]